MSCYRLSFACCFLQLFPASMVISSFVASRTSRSANPFRFLSRSGKGAQAFVLLSDVRQKNGETLASYSFARAGVPPVVGMLVARRLCRERVKAL